MICFEPLLKRHHDGDDFLAIQFQRTAESLAIGDSFEANESLWRSGID